ncbi:PD40 domain-containing protein [candidate division KSB1 bacterium]|nr:PD40 domain-containing protein [candidate division KSB1 bacterium]
MKKLSYLVILIFLAGCGSSKKGLQEQLIPQNVSNFNIQMLKQEIRENPKDAEAHLKLGLIYREMDSLNTALTQIDTALQLNPNYSLARVEKGDLLIRTGHPHDGYAEWFRMLQTEEVEEFTHEIARRLGQPNQIIQLTNSNNNNAYGIYSYDGERIAFQSDRSGNWDIFLMDPDGKHQIQITTNPAHDEMPVFAPNGKVIAFTSTRDDKEHKERVDMNRNIYLMDIAGTVASRIVETGVDDWYPAFTNKNDELLLVSEKDDPREVSFEQRLSDIYMKDLSKGTLIRITQNESDDSAPASSPDGKWIVFISNRTGNFQIFRMDKLGKVFEQVVEFDGQCGSPHYSRDGKRIVFSADRNDGNYEIYTISVFGDKLTQFTNNSAQDGYPSFSPDGKRILFHSNRSGKYQLYAIELEILSPREDVIQLLEDKITQSQM